MKSLVLASFLLIGANCGDFPPTTTTRKPVTTQAATTVSPTTELPTTELPTTTYNCENDLTRWKVDYVGKSSQFKLYNDCGNGTYWIKFKMSGLTEYDESGKKTNNKITSFASQDWYWATQNGSVGEYQNHSALINTYVSTLEVGKGNSPTLVPFNLTTMLFLEDFNLSIYDEFEESITENTFKWSVSIGDWPFLTESNTLELAMNVLVQGGSDDSDSGEVTTDDGKEYVFAGGFAFDTPEYCVTDDGNTTTPMDVTFDVKNSKQIDVYFAFPYFESSLQYDPIITTPKSDFPTTTAPEQPTTEVPTTEVPTTTYDCQTDIGNWQVDYVGKSTQFKLYSACGNGTYFIKFKMSGLTEYDTAGKKTKNKVPSFASQEWRWETSQGGDGQYQNSTALVNTFISTLEVGQGQSTTSVPFNLSTVLFLSDDNITMDDGSTETVTKDTIKWTLNIQDWPFLDADNTLQFQMDLQVGGNSNKDDGGESDSDDGKKYTFADDFVFDTPSFAIIDDENTTVAVDVTFSNKTNDKKLTVYFGFPSFESSLQYDPFAYYDGDGGGGGGDSGKNDSDSTGLAIGLVVAFAVIIFFVSVCFYFRWKRNKEQSTETQSLVGYQRV